MAEREPDKHLGLLSPENAEILKTRGVVGLDMDGVIVDLASFPLAAFNQENGTSYGLGDIKDPFIMDNWYMALYACTKEVANKYTTALWNKSEFLENAPMTRGAMDLLNFFATFKIPFHFITSRPFSTFTSTEIWFNKVGAVKHFDRLLIQTSAVYNRQHKIDTIRSYNVGVHFEDMPAHAMDIVRNTESLVVLVNHPWNEDLPDHPRIIRPSNRGNHGNIMDSLQALVGHLKNGRTS